MQPKCSDALRLVSKDIPLVDKRGWQVKLCDPSLIRAILEHLRDEQVIIKPSTIKGFVYRTFSSVPANTLYVTCSQLCRLASHSAIYECGDASFLGDRL